MTTEQCGICDRRWSDFGHGCEDVKHQEGAVRASEGIVWFDCPIHGEFWVGIYRLREYGNVCPDCEFTEEKPSDNYGYRKSWNRRIKCMDCQHGKRYHQDGHCVKACLCRCWAGGMCSQCYEFVVVGVLINGCTYCWKCALFPVREQRRKAREYWNERHAEWEIEVEERRQLECLRTGRTVLSQIRKHLRNPGAYPLQVPVFTPEKTSHA